MVAGQGSDGRLARVSASFAEALLARAPSLPREATTAWAEQLWAEARATWPAVELQPERFTEFLLARVVGEDGEKGEPSLEALDELEALDLYLACACAEGSSPAIAALERRYAKQIGAVARKASPTRRQEFEQTLRHKLFLPETGKIAGYTGRGSLGAWLRITAKRTYLDLERGIGRRRDAPVSGGADAAVMDRATDGDPELEFLKRHYRQEFREAFAEAMAALAPRHRNVLRQHLVHGLSIDEIGKLYEVHRATAARWITRAREAVLVGTREHMRGRLRVGDAELDSIMRLIESRLEVTLSRHLRAEDFDE